MILLAKVALGFFAVTAAGAGYLVQDGFVHVGVDEFRTDGTHVHLIVPAMAAPIAAHFVPERNLRDMQQVRPYLPMIRESLKILNKLPDTEFVEVRSGDDHVEVRKVSGGINVEVETNEEHVKVWVPLRAMYDSADALESRLADAH